MWSVTLVHQCNHLCGVSCLYVDCLSSQVVCTNESSLILFKLCEQKELQAKSHQAVQVQYSELQTKSREISSVYCTIYTIVCFVVVVLHLVIKVADLKWKNYGFASLFYSFFFIYGFQNTFWILYIFLIKFIVFFLISYLFSIIWQHILHAMWWSFADWFL